MLCSDFHGDEKRIEFLIFELKIGESVNCIGFSGCSIKDDWGTKNAFLVVLALDLFRSSDTKPYVNMIFRLFISFPLHSCVMATIGGIYSFFK